jgi:hypothetical protein
MASPFSAGGSARLGVGPSTGSRAGRPGDGARLSGGERRSRALHGRTLGDHCDEGDALLDCAHHLVLAARQEGAAGGAHGGVHALARLVVHHRGLGEPLARQGLQVLALLVAEEVVEDKGAGAPRHLLHPAPPQLLCPGRHAAAVQRGHAWWWDDNVTATLMVISSPQAWWKRCVPSKHTSTSTLPSSPKPTVSPTPTSAGSSPRQPGKRSVSSIYLSSAYNGEQEGCIPQLSREAVPRRWRTSGAPPTSRCRGTHTKPGTCGLAWETSDTVLDRDDPPAPPWAPREEQARPTSVRPQSRALPWLASCVKTACCTGSQDTASLRAGTAVDETRESCVSELGGHTSLWITRGITMFGVQDACSSMRLLGAEDSCVAYCFGCTCSDLSLVRRVVRRSRLDCRPCRL